MLRPSAASRAANRSPRARELLADQTGDESPAANFAARFHAPQHDQQIAPRRRQRLARQQIAKHHAPAQQQLVGKCLVRGGCGRRDRRPQQRPSSRARAVGAHCALAFPAPAFRIDQRRADSRNRRPSPGPPPPIPIARPPLRSTSLPVARVRSGKNEAPCCRSAAEHLARRMRKRILVAERIVLRRRSSQPPSSRRKIASGATRVGRTRPGSGRSNAGCGDSRPQLTSPDRQS